MQYDEHKRLVSVTGSGGISDSVNYTYNGASSDATSVTFAGQSTYNYEYNAAGELLSITMPNGVRCILC